MIERYTKEDLTVFIDLDSYGFDPSYKHQSFNEMMQDTVEELLERCDRQIDSYGAGMDPSRFAHLHREIDEAKKLIKQNSDNLEVRKRLCEVMVKARRIGLQNAKDKGVSLVYGDIVDNLRLTPTSWPYEQCKQVLKALVENHKSQNTHYDFNIDFDQEIDRAWQEVRGSLPSKISESEIKVTEKPNLLRRLGLIGKKNRQS